MDDERVPVTVGSSSIRAANDQRVRGIALSNPPSY